MIKLAIFDLDGTLLNTIEALTWCTNHTLDLFGHRHILPEETKKIVGDGYRTQLRRALDLVGDTDPEHYQRAMDFYLPFFEANGGRGVVPYDGIPELLAFLKEKKIPSAVFSNKPHKKAVDNIETVFGKDVFAAIRGEMEGVPKKPDPKGALLLAEQFGVKPEECLYLGDTNTDMKTGLAAGMITVGVLWGFRDRAELESFHPQYIVSHPSEVPEIVCRLQKESPEEVSGR